MKPMKSIAKVSQTLVFAFVMLLPLQHTFAAPTAPPKNQDKSLTQILFPASIPPAASLIVSLPDSAAAWSVIASTPLASALSPTTSTSLSSLGVGPLGIPGEAGPFFRDMLSSAEFAVIPAPGAIASYNFLWIGKIKDAPRLRQSMEKFEARIKTAMAASGRPITRNLENIGGAAVTIFTDNTSSIAWFISGDTGTWGFADNADILRDAARGLDPVRQKQSGTALAANSRQDYAKFISLVKNSDAYKIFYYIPAPPTTDAKTTNTLRAASDRFAAKPTGAMVGAAGSVPTSAESSGNSQIAFQNLDLFGTGDTSLAALLYKGVPPSKTLFGSSLCAPSNHASGGSNLLKTDVLKNFLASAIELKMSQIASSGKSAPNPASRQKLNSLAQWRALLTDPAFLQELGPEWFYSLDDFEFLKPGQFPRINFILGARTRNPEATRQKMLSLEKTLLDAARGLVDSKTSESLPAMAEETVDAANGGKIAIRYLKWNQIPPYLSPSWAIGTAGGAALSKGGGASRPTIGAEAPPSPDTLLISLSRETLKQKLAVSAPDTTAQGILSNAANGANSGATNGANSWQILRLGKLSDRLGSLFPKAISQMAPQSEIFAAQFAEAIKKIESITTIRTARPEGIASEGAIRFVGNK